METPDYVCPEVKEIIQKLIAMESIRVGLVEAISEIHAPDLDNAWLGDVAANNSSFLKEYSRIDKAIEKSKDFLADKIDIDQW